MKPVRPYLIRALHAWMVENTWSPHLVVDALYPEVEVPEAFVQNGEIVLDVSPLAVKSLEIGGQFIAFSARFNEDVFDIHLPIFAVRAIYSKENGRGMIFDDDEDDATTDFDDLTVTELDEPVQKKTDPKNKKKSSFRILRDKKDK
jgi:stringent starvation protein B